MRKIYCGSETCLPLISDSVHKIHGRPCFCFYLLVKLNGGRHVTGVLRGFDPFMNIVLDEAIENVSTSEKHNIGMVVSLKMLT